MGRLRTWIVFTAVPAAALLVVAGCNMLTGFGTPTGTLRVLVTDKPFPYQLIEEAVVTVTRVEVRREESEDNDEAGESPAGETDPAVSDGESDVAEADVAESGEGNGPWVTIFEGSQDLDLLDLRNGRTDLLVDVTIEAGTYTEMRVVVTRGFVKLKGDGREWDLRVPSGEQTGIKLKLTFDVAAGEDTVLLLDVDLSRAFSAIPSGMIDDVSTIREFRFTPSVAMRLINQLEAGMISGVVTDDSNQMPLEGVGVTAFKDGVEVTGTATESDGSYALSGLPTGTYRVEFSASGFVGLTVDDVEVQAGETQSLDAALTPVTP